MRCIRMITLPKKEHFKTCFTMAWPSILESFFMAFAGLLDSLMVSSLGPSAVAAVGLTAQPKFIALSIFIALNVSISALVARRRGEGRREDANQIVMTALLFALITVGVISTIFLTNIDAILTLCGTNADTHEDAVTYLSIIMGGIVFNVIQMSINSAQRGSGNTKITMRTNMVSNAINVFGNWVLIGGHLGFPALGVRGAALATVFGSLVASVMSIISILGKDTFISIPFMIRERIRPAWTAFKNILHVGYSIFFEQLLMRIGFMATALMAANQGTDAMAAHQVSMNLMSLAFSFGDGLQAAAVALIGHSLGAQKPDLAKEYGSTCRFMGLSISIILGFVYMLGGRTLFGLFFPKEPDIVDICVHISYVIIVTILFQISQVIYMGCLRGAGDTKYTAMCSMLSVTVIRTVFSYVCCYIFHWGIIGIWMGILADQVSRYICASTRFKQGKWVNIKI
ncbi:MAG: MATE family efflux transporter [Agathobacter sp.]|nr:MATE family efflux transporter [Agathobacter sp.]